MTQSEYLIDRKLNMIELAKTLGNISEACRALGVTRQHYYDVKSVVEEHGVLGLIEKAKNRPNRRNRVPIEFEELVLDYSLNFPTHGQVRVSNELFKQKGIKISSGGIRCIWIRNRLEKVKFRVERLEKWASQNTGLLSESQVIALEESRKEKEEIGEIETHHPGYLLGQDTYYVGYIKGVGKIYQQTGIDTYSSVGFAKLYQDKEAITAADFVNSKVLPFFDQNKIPLLHTLTDRGTEYCGQLDKHPYQLLLQLNGIEHRKTKAYHPQTNGITEKLNQTIKNEFYQVIFRKKLFSTLEELQTELDEFMNYYNTQRTHQGKRCLGKTPMETFKENLALAREYTGGDQPKNEPFTITQN
jgi:hypothetical protein